MDRFIRSRNVLLLNSAFSLWLIGEFMFEYSLISRLTMMLFVGLAIICSRGYGWSKFLTGYLLFALWSVINILSGNAADKNLASDMTETLFLNLLFLYAMTCYCYYVRSLGKILTLYKKVILLCVLPCFVGLVAGTLGSGERVLRVFGMNVNLIATHGAYVSLILMYEFLNARKQKDKVVMALQILFLLVMIFLTGSRKGLILPVIGGYVLICFRNPRRILRYTATTLLAAGLILLLIFQVDFLYDIIGHRIEAVFLFMSGQRFDEASLNSRIGFIELGWEGFLRSPVIGNGLNCFRLERYAYGTYSHSNYIELLYSLGAVGTFLYYYPFIAALKRMLSPDGRRRESTPLFVAILIGHLICDFFMVVYFTRSSLVIPLVVMLYYDHKRKQS